MRTCLGLAVLSLALALAAPLAAEDPPAKAPAERAALPVGWLGHWSGPCRVTGLARAEPLEFPMELHVAPIEGRAAWTWHIVYGQGAARQDRRYEMLAVRGERAHFRVDEKNGIEIDTWLLGDTLYARFSVMRSIIDARYRLDGDRLHVSLVTMGSVASHTSGGKDGIPPVASFPLLAVQQGVLQRRR